MNLLNLGCGYPRIEGEQWVNLDNLKSQLVPGTPEYENLCAEPNYVEHDIATGPLPFDAASFDGVLLSHVLEHFDAQEGLRLLIECHRVLNPGGVVLVSVPDASYFRKVHPEDRNENWPRLFDVSDPNNPIPTFFEAALWFNEHKVLFTSDVLWCYLKRAGFSKWTGDVELPDGDAIKAMAGHLNRRKFSIAIAAYK